jgi:hypothetical protein
MRRGKHTSKQTSKMLTEHVKAEWSCCCVSAHAHVAAAPFAVRTRMQQLRAGLLLAPRPPLVQIKDIISSSM